MVCIGRVMSLGCPAIIPESSGLKCSLDILIFFCFSLFLIFRLWPAFILIQNVIILLFFERNLVAVSQCYRDWEHVWFDRDASKELHSSVPSTSFHHYLVPCRSRSVCQNAFHVLSLLSMGDGGWEGVITFVALLLGRNCTWTTRVVFPSSICPSFCNAAPAILWGSFSRPSHLYPLSCGGKAAGMIKLGPSTKWKKQRHEPNQTTFIPNHWKATDGITP